MFDYSLRLRASQRPQTSLDWSIKALQIPFTQNVFVLQFRDNQDMSRFQTHSLKPFRFARNSSNFWLLLFHRIDGYGLCIRAAAIFRASFLLVCISPTVCCTFDLHVNLATGILSANDDKTLNSLLDHSVCRRFSGLLALTPGGE